MSAQNTNQKTQDTMASEKPRDKMNRDFQRFQHVQTVTDRLDVFNTIHGDIARVHDELYIKWKSVYLINNLFCLHDMIFVTPMGVGNLNKVKRTSLG